MPTKSIAASQMSDQYAKDLMRASARDSAVMTVEANRVKDRAKCTIFSSAALAIGTGAVSAVKIITGFVANIAGVLVSRAAAGTEFTLSGTVVNATFNVFALFMDSAGAQTSAMGTAGATLALVVFPTIPVDKACVGFIIVNPTGAGNFVGGTTGLADGTVIPNTVYVNTVGFFNPKSLAVTLEVSES